VRNGVITVQQDQLRKGSVAPNTPVPEKAQK
jgi:hypothetical protein